MTRDILLKAYAERIVRWRWGIILLSVIFALVASSGCHLLTFNNDYKMFFSSDNPQLIEYEQLEASYTNVDNLEFVVESLTGDFSNPESMAALETLSHKAKLLPYALRVDSITNFQHINADGDDITVSDLVESAQSLSQAHLQGLLQIAQNEPALKKLLISPDNKVGGVNVIFQTLGKPIDEEITLAARKVAFEIEAQYPVKIYLSGVVPLNYAFMESSVQDAQVLVPAMYIMLMFIIFFLVRSISITIITMLILAFSVLTGMGLAGWLGINITAPSSAATTIIMTLAVADSIHIIMSMFLAIDSGMDKKRAVVESVRVNFMPVFLTSITTAIGFLSMNASDSPPFHDLGNITAMGVMAAFIFSITLLPALLCVTPISDQVRRPKLSRWMERFANVVIQRKKLVLICSTVVSIVLLLMIPKNELNENFVHYFDTSTTFRTAADFSASHLTGLNQIQYSIPSGESNGISKPSFLKDTKRFVEWLRSQPEVEHVSSVTDTFQRLNMSMHNDDMAWYKLPESKELAAQYLLLYELSLPYGMDMNNQLNIDKSSTQIVVTLKNITTKHLLEVSNRGENWLSKHAPSIQTNGVGTGVMFANISERNIKNMLISTFVALVLISVLISIALRSIKIGLISLLPNVLPAGLAFGIWGVAVGEINMAAAVVAGMSLGIVVDDSIHFLSKYLRARREDGLTAEQAIHYAFSSVGIAIVATSIILVAGFMVLAQSSFALNSQMALLTSVAILMALFVDFLLLPVLLLRVDRGKL